MSKVRDILGLVVAIVVCQLAGFVGGLFTAGAVSTWYPTLTKPVFTPPAWLFAPVWMVLYTMMGIAAWLVWRSGACANRIRAALAIFAVQLMLNALWSIIFFGLKAPFWAWIELLVLWLAVLATAVAFYRISVGAGVLLSPYQLWVTFAGVLNFYLWQMNS